MLSLKGALCRLAHEHDPGVRTGNAENQALHRGAVALVVQELEGSGRSLRLVNEMLCIAKYFKTAAATELPG